MLASKESEMIAGQQTRMRKSFSLKIKCEKFDGKIEILNDIKT